MYLLTVFEDVRMSECQNSKLLTWELGSTSEVAGPGTSGVIITPQGIPVA